jgi:ATP-dependent Clp protease, protease subunit
MSKWFNIVKAEGAGPDTISITGDIGAYGLSSSEFLAELSSLASDELHLHVTSNGGDLVEAIAMYHGLKNSGKRIHAKVFGMAASAATIPLMAADDISLPRNSFLLIHNLGLMAAGSPEEIQETVDNANKIKDATIDIYAARSKKSKDEVREMMSKETLLTADEAVAMGFADSVIEDVFISNKSPLFGIVNKMPEKVVTAFVQQDQEVDENSGDQAALEVEPLVEQLNNEIQNAGFGNLAVRLIGSLELSNHTLAVLEVKNRMREAIEIRAMCKVLGKPEAADDFVIANKNLESARKALFEEISNSEEVRTQKTQGEPTKQVSALSYTQIYANRKKGK